jgi:carbamoyl-phosphate synthase small subunit
LSNGPGDPAAVHYGIEAAKKFVATGTPVFGICLGHQILGLAYGAKTYKLKFGHRGANHPVKNLMTEKIEISSQNHGFAVEIDTLPSELEATHINLNDHTLSGFRHKSAPVFCVQYHPEAAPGPHDSDYLFRDFVALMAQR